MVGHVVRCPGIYYPRFMIFRQPSRKTNTSLCQKRSVWLRWSQKLIELLQLFFTQGNLVCLVTVLLFWRIYFSFVSLKASSITLTCLFSPICRFAVKLPAGLPSVMWSVTMITP
ncbi:hypothetical protein TorRG33x02_206950 [Trema orientale]|uniref:Uncharacterized protein n=1 Tax=Trema orientale TaxID=63057 RepID=A0A2P5EDE8_TREOI|nr:hypothetical protein TorRG33x02_206950 [Trema orientale]